MSELPSQLVNAAFEQARRTGKQGWQRMTVAVLKNRLLNLTNGEFDETRYGAQTMREFVNLVLDVVTIDDTKFPTVIALRERTSVQDAEPLARSQVRSDLWYAIMNYSRGTMFVWDPDAGRAREALPGDNLEVFPTISESDMRDWRKSFVDQQALLALDENGREKLQAWQERILPSSVLPRPLATAWHQQLKDRVVERLRLWFAEHSLEEPADLLQPFVPPWSEPKKIRKDIETLRQIVIDCVEVMSERELSELRFSPSLLLRAAIRKKPRAH